MNESKSSPVHLPVRKVDAHKGMLGRVLLIGGSRGMAGSITLSSIAAMKTGSGLVSAAVPDRCLETVASFHPCLMTIPLSNDCDGRFSLGATADLLPHLKLLDAIGCGPGMTSQPGSMRIIEYLLQATSPRVFDADAISVLKLLNWPDSIGRSDFGPLILTPHPGELQRLVGVSSKDRPAQLDAASQLARSTGCVIVVKGGPTVVVDGNQTWTNSTGNPGMATGGSGDILTGVVTSLLGQALSPWDAARLGVWIHGRAGDMAAAKYGQSGMTAWEIVEFLAPAIGEVQAT